MAESSNEIVEAIGGYFGLELPHRDEYHPDAIRLNTGRNCLEYILRVRKYQKVYIPYYTCEVILEPFQKLGVVYEYYHIDQQFEIIGKIPLKSGDALLYTNYFGLKQKYVEQLAKCYNKQLIVDNTQAFYARPIEGVDTFYTCRKFFGVPDGAYLYMNKFLDEDFEQDQSFDRVTFLTKNIDRGAEAGYADFLEASKALVGQPIKQMSNFTQRMMQAIDYETVAKQRRVNYNYLHSELGASNILNLPLEENAVPMVYPYLTPVKGMRDKLIANNIFIARYWSNVLKWTENNDLEHIFALQIQPLPIDQRYGEEDMKKTIEVVKLRYY